MFLDFDLKLLSRVFKLLENNPRSGLPHSFKCQLLNVGKVCHLGLWTQTVCINCFYRQTINTNKVIVTVNIFIVKFKCAVIR